MRLLFLLLFSASCFGAQANDTLLYKNKTFRIKLLTTTDSLIQGFLHRVGDSSLLVSGYATQYGALPAGKTYEIGWQRISVMQVKRKGRLGRGILFGGLAGIVAGWLIGLASYEKPDCSGFCLDFGPAYSAIDGSVFGLAGGTLIGLAAGAASKNEFAIGGAWNNFEQMKAAMEKKVRRTK